MSESNPASDVESRGGDADVTAPVDFRDRSVLSFPVVGIGASAGGLQAATALLDALPRDTGMAFVLIQHLPPDHETMMVEILTRRTEMPVQQIGDGMAVQPNNVYVTRPGHTITLSNGRFRLGQPVERPGFRRPIDDFFNSLAREQKERAIAVVLSGMGTNGTAGAQAVKAVGGLCIAQDPDTAEFPSMPRSLIHAGYADQVIKPEDIPAILIRFVRHPYLEPDPAGRARAQEELQRHRRQLADILRLIRDRTERNFTPYKTPTVLRRIQRRMGLFGVNGLDEYAQIIREVPSEAAALANDLMINVTGFFRDPPVWEALRVSVIRPLIQRDQAIRIWATACASGEEPYSLAILIAEEMEQLGKRLDVKIFATDTAEKSLALARAAVYPGGIESNLTPERLERYFDQDEHTYRLKKHIRDQVIFAPQDLLRDPPFSRVDLVTCRNLLIYLEPEAQQRALRLMHFALRDGGYLLLGTAEVPDESEDLFEAVSKRWRIYRRSGAFQHRFASQFSVAGVRIPEAKLPPVSAPIRTVARPTTKSSIQAALLEKLGPPTAVVDLNERILYFHGESAAFLMSPTGEITQNLLEMVRPPLRAAVRHALRQAIAERREIVAEQSLPGPDEQIIRVTAGPLTLKSGTEYFRVSFQQLSSTPVPAVAGTADAQSRGPQTARHSAVTEHDEILEYELSNLQRELQASVEAFETTNAELMASNEEVTSINEELQSTNEELETGKEELQSLNEELESVNGQLQSKVLELEGATNDLRNLLSSTEIAVVFLDMQLRVKGFTPAINDLLELIATDVGRPLSDLAQKFEDERLISDARRVVSTLVPAEAEVCSTSGRWYMRRVVPYRTEDQRIDGVIITFVDISARKRAERTILDAKGRLQAVIEQMPAAVLIAESTSARLVFVNRRAADLFGKSYPLLEIGSDWRAVSAAIHAFHLDGRPYSADEWPLARAVATGETVYNEELEYVLSDGSRGALMMSAAPLYSGGSETVAAVATFVEVTERRVAAKSLRESEERFRLLIESAHDFAIIMLDVSGKVVSWNAGAVRITGFSEPDVVGRTLDFLFTPEDRADGAPEGELRRAATMGQAPDERWHLRKNGSRFWASGMLTAARNDAGADQGFVKIMRDETDRKIMETRMQTALSAAENLRVTAESANRAKDEFIATVSHELRTPLNTIRLWSRMLASGKVQLEEAREGILMIERAAVAQQQLIDDLLDVSRMASGKFRLSLRDTDLAKAIEEAVESVRQAAATRKVTLQTDLSADVGVVRADPDRLQQVVWNLLTNAVKFTPSGGTVSVTLAPHLNGIEIVVQDTGIGIRPEFLPQVFDRFRQADSSTSRQHSGLGLGLAIAKQLVELHGGTINAFSEGEGRGARFTVRLPHLEPSAEPLAAGQDEGQAAVEGALSGVHVLLVEDDAGTRQATAILLRQHGAQVREVDSAAAARDALKIRTADLLVSDVGLAGEDGYMLIQELRRAEQAGSNAPLTAVAVTAFAGAEDRKKALTAGFNEHISKPLNPDQFISTLARLLRRR